MDSILDSIKKALGIQPDYDMFDAEITMHINSTFSTLHQLGVGPREPFMIDDKETIWMAFTEGAVEMNSVRSYMFLKVRLLFDPPATSHARTMMDQMAKEYEWRLNVASDWG